MDHPEQCAAAASHLFLRYRLHRTQSDRGEHDGNSFGAYDRLAVGDTTYGVYRPDRMHRSNLIGMGLLPLQFQPGESVQSLGLSGEEVDSITGLERADPVPREVTVRVEQDGRSREFTMTVRIDTPAEAEYFRHGGILQYVLRQLVAS